MDNFPIIIFLCSILFKIYLNKNLLLIKIICKVKFNK